MAQERAIQDTNKTNMASPINFFLFFSLSKPINSNKREREREREIKKKKKPFLLQFLQRTFNHSHTTTKPFFI